MRHRSTLPCLRGICIIAILLLSLGAHTVCAQLVLSGNENKLIVGSGGVQTVPNAKPDSVSVIHFDEFPPRVQHIIGVSNSVIGPPSNIVITPDHRVALVTNAVNPDADSEEGFVPDTVIHVIDLTASPPKVVGTTRAGRQPSGLSVTPDGRHVLVANRADGSVTLLSISGTDVQVVQTVKVAEPEDQVSDVAISPDGKLVLASVYEGYYLAVLKLEDGKLTLTDRKLSVAGKPYRTVITADGTLGLTAGGGQDGPDTHALTVIDLTADPIRTVDYVSVGNGPESFGVSPDGQLVAVMLFNGASNPPGDVTRTEHGLLRILARRGKTFKPVQTLPLGRVTQGAAFTSDGKYLLAQCHDLREIRVYRVSGESVEDTGHRIKTPGHPSSIRAAP